MVELNTILYNDILQKVQIFYKASKLDKQEAAKGRKLAIPIQEIIALSIYKHTHGIPTKIAVYKMFSLDCSYKTLVVNMNRFAEFAALILLMIIKANRGFQHWVKHTDSTDLPVCSNRKAKHHKTMAALSSWSHTGKGAFYGLKLHITADLNERILAIRFSTAVTDDREVFMDLNKDLTGVFVADAAYISQKLSQDFHIEGERILFAKPRKNMKKIATAFQTILYNTRMTIELNFRNLKCFYNLITSLPRSVNGYLANYIYALLAYLLDNFVNLNLSVLSVPKHI
jgi:hypothetical protein